MQFVEQGQAIGAHSGIVGHDHDVIEKIIDGTAAFRQGSQTAGKIAFLEALLGFGAQLLDLPGQLLFSRFVQQTGVNGFGCQIGPAQYVADALVGGGQAGGFRLLGKIHARCDARMNLMQGRPYTQDGIHDLAVILLHQLVAIALVNIVSDFSDRVVLKCAGGELPGCKFQDVLQIQTVAISDSQVPPAVSCS